jgi:hypothetical protein
MNNSISAMRKKGQMAIEFMTTYGWAFLLIIVVVSGLAYFGVLSPDKYLADKCVAPVGFYCIETTVTTEQIHLRYRNIGDALKFEENTGKLLIRNSGLTCELDSNNVTLPTGNILSNREFDIVIDTSSCDFPSQIRMTYLVEAEYVVLGKTLIRKMSTEVNALLREP